MQHDTNVTETSPSRQTAGKNVKQDYVLVPIRVKSLASPPKNPSTSATCMIVLPHEQTSSNESEIE